ncbi:MAG: hypothetical protein GY940_44840, partial [bacterium]|nr:hypothetical protein [bacterium]
VNGIDVGLNAGAKLDTGYKDGQITLGGGLGTNINIGDRELKFETNGSVTLDAKGGINKVHNAFVDGVYEPFLDLGNTAKKSASNLLKETKGFLGKYI